MNEFELQIKIHIILISEEARINTYLSEDTLITRDINTYTTRYIHTDINNVSLSIIK